MPSTGKVISTNGLVLEFLDISLGFINDKNGSSWDKFLLIIVCMPLMLALPKCYKPASLPNENNKMVLSDLRWYWCIPLKNK